MRAFDLLAAAEYEIRGSSQPRHQFEMALVKWIHLRQLTPLSDIIAGLEGSSPRRPAASGRQAPDRPSPRRSRTPEPQNPRTSEPQSPRTSAQPQPVA